MFTFCFSPPPGSKSEKRGLRAAAHINSEMALLCDMIYQEGQQFEDGRAAIRFADLFQVCFIKRGPNY